MAVCHSEQPLNQSLKKPESFTTLRHTANPSLLLACGTFSSTFGQLASDPLALVRTHMQTQGSSVLPERIPIKHRETLCMS